MGEGLQRKLFKMSKFNFILFWKKIERLTNVQSSDGKFFLESKKIHLSAQDAKILDSKQDMQYIYEQIDEFAVLEIIPLQVNVSNGLS